MSENTGLFNLSVVKKTMIKETVKEIYDSLKEKGYNPINQIVGYLMSGDENYISNYQNAREKILELDRAQIIEFLLTESLK
ncbi:MAG: IreB family regulatory phosphoprotein [Bacilli bacterium]|jgi:uncharacterized protein (UPF0297 family)|nr:IreB family regulatory phosphoprotein [Bacilli bacterium]